MNNNIWIILIINDLKEKEGGRERKREKQEKWSIKKIINMSKLTVIMIIYYIITYLTTLNFLY